MRSTPLTTRAESAGGRSCAYWRSAGFCSVSDPDHRRLRVDVLPGRRWIDQTSPRRCTAWRCPASLSAVRATTRTLVFHRSGVEIVCSSWLTTMSSKRISSWRCLAEIVVVISWPSPGGCARWAPSLRLLGDDHRHVGLAAGQSVRIPVLEDRRVAVAALEDGWPWRSAATWCRHRSTSLSEIRQPRVPVLSGRRRFSVGRGDQ